jgi:hypothetical protein
MYELFTNNPHLMDVLAPLGLIAITILSITAMVLFRSYKKAKLDADLKMNMLDRGMSAEEIERVIAAKPGCMKQ